MKEDKNPHKDVLGEDTLLVIQKADQFNKWMYETIEPHCHGKILEIGSGIGNLSHQFLRDGHTLMLSDFNTDYCQQLRADFSDYSNCLGVQKVDLVHSDFDAQFSDQLGSYDTLFALNVVEHIANDQFAILNCKKLLKKNGTLIILVPAYQFLYNNFDKGLGHYRRYTKSSLTNLFIDNEFEISHSQYFNFIGIFGWLISGSIFRMKQISGNQMQVYNFFVPFIKFIDRLIRSSVGLSTIVIGKK